MSKREIRAKRLVAAVLLAISVQMWSAPPLWAAEASVQTETSAAGEAKETKDAKDAKAADSETGGEADADEGENVVVPVIGYSTRSAAGSDYGVMPLADAADPNPNFGGEWTKNASGVYESNGKGELTGVTKINGIFFQYIEDNPSLAIGDYMSGDYTYSLAIGGGAGVTADSATAVGFSTSAEGANSTAIGNSSVVYEKRGTAIGASAYVQRGHTGSVAIGYDSATTAADQVAFGTGKVTTDDGPEVITWTNRRSLAGISDIDMEGTINLGGMWTRNATSDAYESNGKGKLTGLTSINDTEVFIGSDGDALVVNIGAYLGPGAMGTISLGEGNYVDGSYAISLGYNVTTKGSYSISIGAASQATKDYSTALGGDAYADGVDSTAIGHMSRIEGKNSTALGANSTVAAEHTNSVAIGSESATSAADQVSFGHKAGDKQTTSGSATYDTDLFRSLINVADIDMHGNISLGGEWKENTTSGLYESNGKGELNGVTSINGVIFAKDSMNNQEGLLIGTLAPDTYYAGGFSVMIGTNIDNQAIDAVGIGNDIKLTGDGSVAIGNSAEALSSGGGYPTAIGFSARAIGDDVVAIGAKSYAEHEYSVALGDDSSTSAENQVSFGHKAGDKYGDGGRDTYGSDLFRSLINVADIDMHGALTGVTGIDGVTVSGTDASTGMTVGGNAVIGKTDTPFSSTGFAVAKDGAVTAKTVNGATITGTGFNGVTLSTDGKVNGAVITSNSFNGVTLEKGADSHYKVGGVDVTKMQTDVAGKADAATTLTGYGITDAYTKTETDTAIGKKADKATTLTGYGIVDAYTKTETDTAIGKKADKATTLAGYGIADAYTKTETDTSVGKKADKATTLTGYGIADAYTKTETDTAIGKKADKATTLTGYGITDAYTKTAADAKITAATADMATKTQVTADIGTAKTALESAYQAADTALSNRAAALETAATGMSYDAGKNTTTFTGGVTATVLTAGEFKVGATGFGFGNDGALTAKTVNGIEIKKDESKVMVGGIDLTALSNGDVVTDNTKGIGRNQDTATTTIETNTAISSSGITTNAVTASGTVKAGEFVEGSQKLSDKYAAIGEAYTAEKAALKADKSDVDTLKTTIGDSTTGLAAVNTKVGALDTAYQAADTQIRTDFAAADNALKTELNTAIDEKAKKATDLAGYGITDAYTITAADAKITAATADMATKTQVTADIGTAKTALESAYQAADTALSNRAAALETAATGMSYDAGKNTTTFTGGVTATVLTAGEFKVGATGFGFGNDGALTAKTVNGIEIKKDESKVMVGGIDLTALSNGDVVTDNTKGIGRNQDTATTTIETNTAISSSGITTNAVTASGTVKASEFVEGDKKLSDKYAAKTALDDYTTTTDMNTKLADYATTTAVDTKLADYAKSDSVYSKAAADTAFAKADASNLPSDVSGWQSKLGISDISSKLAGFSYDNTSGTTTIGGVKLKGGTLADVKSLNGKAVGADGKGITIDGIGLKDLSERVTAIENNGGGTGGGSTADTEGIKRTDVADGSGKTVIEGATGFTKDGLKTANLEAATAALGGVNFAAGAVTGVSSINGISFADGKLGGVSLSGGKVNGADITSTSFNGVDVKALKNKVDNLTPGSGGGTGGGDNTGGISKPDGDTTNIEGNTSITTDGVETNKVTATDSITVADATNNKTTISDKGIVVAEGKKNQVTISEDGIHVGKNSSVVNDTDGFITDKGLYIGVSSSSDTSTAKFSVAPNGNLSSKAGDYGFSNTSADGAKFTHSGDTAYGTGSQLDTTIQGNKVTTGRVDTDELYVDGNKVTVAGGTINQTDAVDNHLSGTDADGNTVTNDFKTSAVNGTTQAAEKTSADGKESTKTVNNTSAGGTSVTTSRTTTDSKDNVTVKESSFGTNEKGMTLSTSNKVTDKDGKVTKDTSGTTTMTGDSISVSKTTTTTEKDADGNEKEVTKTSGTTIGSGEVTLKREDGSTIEVGSAIEGMQSDMRELDGRVNRMGVEIKEVGALSAALAGLHPQPENANSRADFAMAVGSYEGKQALAVGGFYRPDKRTMLSIGASTTSSKHMMNMGISIALDRLPEAERKAKEAAKAAGVEQETLNRVLERLAALEQDNRRLQADNEKRDVAYEKLAADYTQLKEKYIEETADRQQPEQAEAEE